MGWLGGIFRFLGRCLSEIWGKGRRMRSVCCMFYVALSFFSELIS